MKCKFQRASKENPNKIKLLLEIKEAKLNGNSERAERLNKRFKKRYKHNVI